MIVVVLCSAGICLAHFGPRGFETAVVTVDDVNTYANVVFQVIYRSTKFMGSFRKCSARGEIQSRRTIYAKMFGVNWKIYFLVLILMPLVDTS